MRSTWSFAAVAIVTGLSFAACAQSVADDGGIFDNDAGSPDPGGDVDASDSGHHDYGSHDSGASGDTGGGNSGDASTPTTDASTADGGSKDSGPGHDSGGGIPDTGAPDTSVPTGGTTCGSNSKYVLEALAASLDPNVVACTDGSECTSAECCEIGFCVGL